jgi:hypothetical protein
LVVQVVVAAVEEEPAGQIEDARARKEAAVAAVL